MNLYKNQILNIIIDGKRMQIVNKDVQGSMKNKQMHINVGSNDSKKLNVVISEK